MVIVAIFSFFFFLWVWGEEGFLAVDVSSTLLLCSIATSGGELVVASFGSEFKVFGRRTTRRISERSEILRHLAGSVEE